MNYQHFTFIYNITETKICSVKFIIRRKTIVNFNYNQAIYFAQWKDVGCKTPNIANLQAYSIMLQISSIYIDNLFFL